MLKALKFASVLVALSTPALAEVNGTLRIGVLNDMSSVYADFQGPGSVRPRRWRSRTLPSNQNVKLRYYLPIIRTSLTLVLALHAGGSTWKALT